MKRLLALAATALAPGAAHAAVGTSYGVGLVSTGVGSAYLGWLLPSVDLRSETSLIQIRAMDTLANLAEEDIFLAGSYWIPMLSQDLGEGAIVAQPGGSAALWNYADWGMAILGGARIGSEWGASTGLGVYVVPQLGVAYDDPDVEVVFSGMLELSVWLSP